MFKEFSITNKFKRYSSQRVEEIEYFLSFSNLTKITTINIGYDNGAHQEIHLTPEDLDDLVAGLDSVRKSLP